MWLPGYGVCQGVYNAKFADHFLEAPNSAGQLLSLCTSEFFAGSHSLSGIKVPPIVCASDNCPFCGGSVRFDPVLDINICYACGAHETLMGWMRAGPAAISFTYSFQCPRCDTVIDSGEDLVLANSRELVPPEVQRRHPKCPHCRGPIRSGEIKLEIRAAV